MEKIFPIFYSEYGRYITKLRAIPWEIDCLKPVERRLLLGLHKEARQKNVKSIKVVGTTMGLWHGHGDQSVYGSLVRLVQQGYAIGQGNWGAYSRFGRDKAAGYRYTEVKLSPWVDNLAFKYYKFVQWDEIEQDIEPLSLPFPVPLGLIGTGIIEGIAFHKTTIPKYSFDDLIKRCISLIEGKPVNENIIKPSIKGCTTQQVGQQDYLDLLTNGTGELYIIPNGKILKKKIEILGRSPFKSFNTLLKNIENKNLNVHVDDECGEEIKLIITPKKSKTDINKLSQEIWSNYLISNSKFNCYTCNENGQIQQLGIDELIKISYTNWSNASLNKKINDLNNINKRKFENNVIEIIRYIFEKYKTHKIEELIKHYKTYTNGVDVLVNFDKYDVITKNWLIFQASIEVKDLIDVCKKKTIQRLIEHKNEIKIINNDLNLIKQQINAHDSLCIQEVKQMKLK